MFTGCIVQWSGPRPVEPQTGVRFPVQPPTDDDEWDQHEDDGPLDLEDQLERALDEAFPKR